MTDSEIFKIYQDYPHTAFNNSVGGRIVFGEKNVVWYSPDGNRVGGFYQISGWQKITDAYWDKMDGYVDIVHIETSSGDEIYVSNGSSGKF